MWCERKAKRCPAIQRCSGLGSQLDVRSVWCKKVLKEKMNSREQSMQLEISEIAVLEKAKGCIFLTIRLPM